MVVVGFDPRDDFRGCDLATTLLSEVDVDNDENGAEVWTCDAPVGGWDSAYSERLVAAQLPEISGALTSASSLQTCSCGRGSWGISSSPVSGSLKATWTSSEVLCRWACA